MRLLSQTISFYLIALMLISGHALSAPDKARKSNDSSEFQESNPTHIVYQLGVGYYDQDFHRLSGEFQSDDLTLIFPIVAGSLFGQARDQILDIAEANKQNGFELTLPINADRYARRFVGRRESAELKVNPESLRLLRLATFHSNDVEAADLGGGAFIHRDSSDFMLLIYFSEPVKIKGRMAFDDVSYELDFNLLKSGWQWFQVVDLGSDDYQLKPYNGNPSDIEFAVILDNQISL